MLARKLSAMIAKILRRVCEAMGTIASRRSPPARTEALAVLRERDLAITNACDGFFGFSFQGCATLFDWLLWMPTRYMARKKQQAFESVRQAGLLSQVLSDRSRFKAISRE